MRQPCFGLLLWMIASSSLLIACGDTGGQPAQDSNEADGSGGTTDSGGATASGATSVSSGGRVVAGGSSSTGGSVGSSGGRVVVGGTTSLGGSTGTGGTTSSSGGRVVAGGSTTGGSTNSSGGSVGPGGTTSLGGSTGTGGTTSSGGRGGAGGTSGTGGTTSSSGGRVGLGGTTGAGGSAGTGGAGGMTSEADCRALISDPGINWRESSLQTDQEIVGCLSSSLGRPVGYGENALGGYDPAGGSKLTIITKSSSVSVEQQVADAVSGEEHNWIVFDKVDFASPYEIALYRLKCGEPDVQAALGISSPELCVDYQAWCSANGVSSSSCLETFFNERLNDGDLPIRNVRIGSHKTIDGRQSQAYFMFSGFAIGSDSNGEPVDTATSVIVTSLLFQGAGHTEDHGLDPDMIRSTGASHDIWIHQNTFDLTGDSAFDVKVGAYNVTLSFNLVKNVKRAALHGSSDSRTINEQIATTMHHNAFITTDGFYDTFGNTARRVPLIRRGKSHLFDNVFYNYRKDVLSVRVGGRVLFEDNMFLANPAVAGDDDIDYYVENLLDGYEEGGLRITGSTVWLSDSDCNLNPSASGDLSASYGSTPDMFSEYGAASRSTISAHRLEAGQELADYVLATAGKDGAAPFNSPYTEGRAAIANLGHRACR